MKCKLIRDDLKVSSHPDAQYVAANSEERMHRGKLLRFWKVGTILDTPDAFRLVRNGDAEAADSECEARVGVRTPEQIARTLHERERLARGVHPEDFKAYDAGLMIGYDGNGNWIPGPNATEETLSLQTESEEEDDEQLALS
jgi:hypothetical protein